MRLTEGKAVDGLRQVRAPPPGLVEGGRGWGVQRRLREQDSGGPPSDSLPPPRGRSHGAGDLPEAEGELPGLEEECLATLGCLLGQHCHHQI